VKGRLSRQCGVKSLAVKQLPDILTSTTFWASVATMWAASGAWFTYVAALIVSKEQTYEAIQNLIEGLEVELALESEWAAGDDGNEGYLSKTIDQVANEHPDWFNPSRAIIKFDTPTLMNLTSSPYVRLLKPIIRPFVVLSYSIRRLFDTSERCQAFVFGDVAMYQSVLPKFAVSAANDANAIAPEGIPLLGPPQIGLTSEEQNYVNQIFIMNEMIHQRLIGGADSNDKSCLYLAFRNARAALQQFKNELHREPLPTWFPIMHLAAGALALVGFWQVVRWFGIL
jgi:hypothetical protein